MIESFQRFFQDNWPPYNQYQQECGDHYHQKYVALFAFFQEQKEWLVDSFSWINSNYFTNINCVWKLSMGKQFIFFHIRLSIIFRMIIKNLSKSLSSDFCKLLSEESQACVLFLWDQLSDHHNWWNYHHSRNCNSKFLL